MHGPLVRIWHVEYSRLVVDLDRAFAMAKCKVRIYAPQSWGSTGSVRVVCGVWSYDWSWDAESYDHWVVQSAEALREYRAHYENWSHAIANHGSELKERVHFPILAMENMSTILIQIHRTGDSDVPESRSACGPECILSWILLRGTKLHSVVNYMYGQTHEYLFTIPPPPRIWSACTMYFNCKH